MIHPMLLDPSGTDWEKFPEKEVERMTISESTHLKEEKDILWEQERYIK